MDIDRADGGSLEALAPLAERLPIGARERARVEGDTGRADIHQAQDRLHLTLEALEGDALDRLERHEIDLLAGPDIVVTVHVGRVEALERFIDGFDGETRLGALSAADLLSSLIDEVIAGYFVLVERMEREIDELDTRALRGRPGDDLLAALVTIRRQISLIRRTLAPHRSALAALARPEAQAEDVVGRPWTGLSDRLEGAMEAVDGLRDSLLGTYDIHMGRAAQRANDVMKTLTLLSAVLLPSAVLAGVMGMNFQLAFFDSPSNFFVVVLAMALLAGLILGISRRRRWW